MGTWGTCIGELIDRNHNHIGLERERNKNKDTHNLQFKSISLDPSLYTNPRRILRKKKGNFDTNAAKTRDLHRRRVYSIFLINFS